MVKGQRPQIVILHEDLKHYHFALKFLELNGWNPRQVRSGMLHISGSGEQRVREHLAKEVALYRSKANHLNNALLCITDADRYSPDQRRSQLDEQLRKELHSGREQNEKIVYVAPKWSIETWFQFLETGACDENLQTGPVLKKNFNRPARAATLLHDRCSRDHREGLPDSLRDACLEWERFLLLV